MKLRDDIFPDKKVVAFGELFDLSADEAKTTITGFIGKINFPWIYDISLMYLK